MTRIRYHGLVLSKVVENLLNIMDFNKLIIPVSIIIGSLVIGGFFYAIQVNKQESIEMQQRLELQSKQTQQTLEDERKQKEYLAERKSDCLDIYTTEDKKWNNIRGWRFDESNELCYIRYKDPKPKTDEECDSMYSTKGDFGHIFFRDNLLCKDGEFENTF